ncbi:beta-ketothiolase BktB [Novosphingobium rosa]|uniref:beta-ketothiolase BktB n=1 Tax=Novosphingobium rosa TaxID=76978 RepID=UPI000834FDB4|nr:beta-ketothiolase BktB [Novosphingobium rosa]
MSTSDHIYIVSGVRTAIGDFGGSLKGFAASDLGGRVVAEALARSSLAPADVEHVVMGQVIHTSGQDAYLARVAALKAGIPHEVPALTVNRLCGSGLQAIVSAAQMMMLGEAEVTVAGGAESMSNAPYHDHGQRWGRKMGDGVLIDAMVQTLSDPLGGYHMGVTAENVAQRCDVTREEQDALAVEGHARAMRAIGDGRFREQILPLEIKSRKGVTIFDTDEHPRAGIRTDDLASMKPVFKTDGTVTAANASGINDGAAAMVLATGAIVKSRSLQPLARIVSWGHAGVDPAYMGLGPIKAVPVALSRAGLTLADMDVVEANEAFAAQAVAVSRELGFDAEKLNPNGSGIALGHPIGATGAILTVKAAYELRRNGGRYALITMCIGGGQGIAMVIEAV